MESAAENGTDTSRCFVPEILINLLKKQISNDKATIPTSHFVHGVCLLVDISGFTKLSAEFCEKGKNGIDGLQLATNGFMGKLVETIYMYGGDIIKFAGDAIICLFPTTLMTKLVKTKTGKVLRRSITTADMIFIQSSCRDVAVSNISGLPRSDSGSNSRDSTIREDVDIKPDVLLRAMQCANKLKTIVQDTLTVHVAISCGKMSFAVLGGFEDRWECLISGPCLQDLSACLDEAPSMQAVMTAGCFDVLQGGVEHSFNSSVSNAEDATQGGKLIRLNGYKYSVSRLPSGNCTILNVLQVARGEVSAAALPGTSGLSSAQVTPRRRLQDSSLAELVMQFVPTVVASGIKQGTGLSYISEIREVTTMFMKWDAYDVNIDLIELQEGFFEAQRILHSTGAYLRQFLVDDKGCVLIACWGMPSQSYLDNAHRALTAAVETRTALLELQMKCSFGITTGDVYCGTVGSALRMEYAAIGSVVNMAARLMGKAHGGILIDEPTFLRLPAAVQLPLEKLALLQVKGRADPLQVYQHSGMSSVLSSAAYASILEDNTIELRECCREPLTTLLDRLTGAKSRELPYTRGAAFHRLFPSMSPMSMSESCVCPTTIASVLVEGNQGTGCKASTSWLNKQALKRGVCTAHVKLAAETILSPFYLLFKIFSLLGPKDLYRDKLCQRRYVHALLKEVYADDGDQVAQCAFPIMKQTLSLTCTYSRDHSSPPDSPGRSSILRIHGTNPLYRQRSSMANKFSAHQITAVLVTIFTHLLTERTVLVIIDDIHHADEESLRVLLELLKIADSKSAIVMCAAAVACGDPGTTATEIAASISLKHVAAGAGAVAGTGAGAWSSRIHSEIVSNDITNVIAVAVFSTAEIAAMLSTLPESAQFSPTLPLLVLSLSGGEFAWIKEVLRFLREFGAARLLTIMEDLSQPSTTANDLKLLTPTSAASEGNVAISTQIFNRYSTANKVVPTLNRTNQFKIDQLMVCRYENLRASTKHILRSASIIGRSFQRQVLYGVLPRNLKAEIADCLHTLVQHQWLQQSAEEPELYEFRYEYSHQIIYHITPESERRNQHKVVADYIEEISAGDASQAAQLCYHYGMCDTDKALQYTYIAATSLLEFCTPLQMCECIDLLFSAVPHCTLLRDVEVLRMLTSRAISRTNEYSSQLRPLTNLFKRVVKQVRTGFLSWFHRRDRKILPASAMGYGVSDYYDYGDEEDEGESDESRNTLLLHNTQAREHFLCLLRHLTQLLVQRKSVILKQRSGGVNVRLPLLQTIRRGHSAV